MTVSELAGRYTRLPAALRDVAAQFPHAIVVRNAVGNLGIVGVDGSYVGWIDVLEGKVHLTTGAPSDI